jgi:hypothetical protein
MCGRDCAVSVFAPESLDLDIYTRQAVPQGYKKGFTYTDETSVLGDDVFTPMIMDRCIAILNLMIQNEILTTRELAKETRMGSPILGTEDVLPYEDVINNLFVTEKWLKEEKDKLFRENKLKDAQLEYLKNSTVGRDTYKKLKKDYENLGENINRNNKIDRLLLQIHNMTKSEISLSGDSWMLRILELELDSLIFMYRILYTLTKIERKRLQERIYKDCNDLNIVFFMMTNEPQIKSKQDLLTKKPNQMYYLSHESEI